MQRYSMPYENTCTYAVCIAGSVSISENVTIQGEMLNKFHWRLWDLDLNHPPQNPFNCLLFDAFSRFHVDARRG